VVDNSRVRKERQAAALRENLKRRKARARVAGEGAPVGPETGPNGASDEHIAAVPPERPNPAAKNT
jgi:hypothetical protein